MRRGCPGSSTHSVEMWSSSLAQLLDAVAGSMENITGTSVHPSTRHQPKARNHTGLDNKNAPALSNHTNHESPPHTQPTLRSPTLRPQPSLSVGSVTRASSRVGPSTSVCHCSSPTGGFSLFLEVESALTRFTVPVSFFNTLLASRSIDCRYSYRTIIKHACKGMKRKVRTVGRVQRQRSRHLEREPERASND